MNYKKYILFLSTFIISVSTLAATAPHFKSQYCNNDLQYKSAFFITSQVDEGGKGKASVVNGAFNCPTTLAPIASGSYKIEDPNYFAIAIPDAQGQSGSGCTASGTYTKDSNNNVTNIKITHVDGGYCNTGTYY